MRFYSALALLVLVSGCEFLQAQLPSAPAQQTAKAKEPGKYQCTSRCLAPGQYEIVMNGTPGVAADELKTAFKSKGTELCENKVYLLRGMREEQIAEENRTDLKGQVDCVELDYFEN